MTPVLGLPMLHRVVGALRDSKRVSDITLVGPGNRMLDRDPTLRDMIDRGELAMLEPAASPSLSAYRGLTHIHSRPVLVTTADHALLQSDIVDYFLERSQMSGCDVTVALTPLATVMAKFPENRRTAIKLKGGPYCGSNLFAFMTEESAKVADFWKDIEQRRKNPKKVVMGALGIASTVRYLLGTLSLDQAMQRISHAVGVRVGAVIMPFADAAVDIDTVEDFLLVEKTLRLRASM
ncbi:nucleotidyltransferase family protein [Pseudomonas sp. RC10]|uniref:nucleotidyltransferase family protein n=1 Tax=Pseudomonas bambusae TaxID=3139142 RepID=UPI00313905B2